MVEEIDEITKSKEYEEVQNHENDIDQSCATKPNTQNPNPSFIDKDTLVATAVHFLQNTKVKNVPLTQKRAFLLKKGLSNEDIDIAIERVSQSQKDLNLNQKNGPIGNSNLPLVPYQQGPVMIYQTPSLWYRWREFCSSLMVIGATFYGFYFIFKRYIEPLIIGKRKQEEDRMTKIERHLMELNKSLSQLRHSLVCVESTLCRQQTKNGDDDQLSIGIETNSQGLDLIALADMKGDISTIKSLLLSRNQFPATPTSSLSIPAWQLKQQEAAEKSNIRVEEETEDSYSENAESVEETKKSDEEFEKVPNGVAINGNVSDH